MLFRRIALILAGCLPFALLPANTSADIAWGVTGNQFLISWNTSTPGTINSGVALSGLQINETIVGMDFRPDDNMLYGIGSTNRLYQLDLITGMATQVGPQFGVPLNGSQFGYDFNPTIDRSRIDTDTNKNYVVNPNNGSQSLATDLFYTNGDPNFGIDPNVVHIGYTNSFSGSTMSQLYGIDSGLDILVTQANSAGTLATVGSLGLDITGVGGFDIFSGANHAYGVFIPEGSSQSFLYRIDLSSGSASLVGQIGGGTTISAFAIQGVPEPSTAMFLLAGASLICLQRRRKTSNI